MKMRLIPFLTSIPVVLAGCGGNSSDSPLPDASSSARVISGEVISSSALPMENRKFPTAGVSGKLTDEIIVYVLTDEDKAGNAKILSDSSLTNGDKSDLAGGTFLIFSGLEGRDDTAVVTGAKVQAVYECDKIKRECRRAAVSWGDERIVFSVKSDKFYALKNK